MKLNPPVVGFAEAPKENAEVVVVATVVTGKGVLSRAGFCAGAGSGIGLERDWVVASGLKVVAMSLLPNDGTDVDDCAPKDKAAGLATAKVVLVAVTTAVILLPNEKLALGASVTEVVDAGVLVRPKENAFGGSTEVVVAGTVAGFEAATFKVVVLEVVVGVPKLSNVVELPNENVLFCVSAGLDSITVG